MGGREGGGIFWEMHPYPVCGPNLAAILKGQIFESFLILSSLNLTFLEVMSPALQEIIIHKQPPLKLCLPWSSYPCQIARSMIPSTVGTHIHVYVFEPWKG